MLFLSSRGLPFVVAAIFGNAALVGAVRGLEAIAFYLWIVAPPSVLLPYLMLKRKTSIPQAVAVVGGVELVLVMGAFLGVGAITGKSPFLWLSAEVDRSLELLEATLGQPGVDRATLKRDVLMQMPSGIALFLLMVVLGNLLLWMRGVPASVRSIMRVPPGSLKSWKTPEWLIWPALVVAALAIFGQDIGPSWLSIVGWNLLYVVLAIYGLQGLSIFAWCLEAWKVRGVLRSIFVVVTLLLMRPLLVAIGVLDLWFDFRSRVRQN